LQRLMCTAVMSICVFNTNKVSHLSTSTLQIKQTWVNNTLLYFWRIMYMEMDKLLQWTKVNELTKHEKCINYMNFHKHVYWFLWINRQKIGFTGFTKLFIDRKGLISNTRLIRSLVQCSRSNNTSFLFDNKTRQTNQKRITKIWNKI
jgi:hypothetical protein